MLDRRSLALAPRTLDREARTVEAVASTGAAVQRRDARGPFLEVLDLAGADLSRLVGGPVLDAHRQGSRRDQLGVVTAARVERGALVVTMKITARAEGDEVLADMEAGIIRGVSLGYSVAEWREERGSGARRLVAAKWTPLEISLVPIPADPGATIRSEHVEDQQHQDIDRGAAKPEAEPSAPEHAEAIRSIAATAGLARAWADSQIDAGATPDEARAAAFDEMRRRQPPIRTRRVEIVEDHDDPAVRAARIGEALFARANPGHELSEPARAFAGLSIPEIGRDILRRAGVSTTGLSAASVITRALHTTSDFALILGDTVGRSLRMAYQAAPAGMKLVARQTTARDFREKRRLQLSQAPLPERVGEGGEFTSGTLAEAAETYKLATFGKIVGISRQALVNDDLGAFTDLSRRMGIACAEFETQQLVDLLVQGSGLGPAMSDGKTLFHADHGNIGVAGAISLTTLSEARTKMRRQKDLTGRPISVTPRFVVVPPELETVAEAELAEIAPTRTEDVNPFSGRFSLAVESRLANMQRWYVVADPAEIDGLEYAYLEGAPGPQIESRNGFEIDGVQIKVRLDFGCGFVDWRGWLTNAGA